MTRESQPQTGKELVVAITGASGAAYAQALCRLLVTHGARVHVVISAHGEQLLRQELGLTEVSPAALLGPRLDPQNLRLHDYCDLADPLSSGSVHTDGMAVCPCSSNTLAAIAAGLADNLITRAAHVHLKQRRRLVLVPREMPLSTIELENQLRLSHAGATIAPASPAFYQQPRSVDDLVQFVARRVADALGVHADGTEYRPL